MPKPDRASGAHEFIPPRILKHKRSGSAFVVLREPDGRRRQVQLGPWNSAQSRRAYRELLAKLTAAHEPAVALRAPVDHIEEVTVGELVARFLAWAETYYVSPIDRQPTGEAENLALALTPVLELYGDTEAEAFGVREFRIVRERLISPPPDIHDGKERRPNRGRFCRTTINDRMKAIRRCWRWAAEHGFVRPETWQALAVVSPIRFGRDARVRETQPRGPVPMEHVERTLPFLGQVLADVVRVQLRIGCRPGEILRLTTRELDRTEAVAPGVWLFTPTRSKVAFRRKPSPYGVGPQAQEILRRYLRADPDAPLFQPAESEALRRRAQRAARKSKVQPSQQDRRKENPVHGPSLLYDPRAYARAVRRACVQAGVPPWSPHQLRHLAATLARARAGAEVARVILGHSDLNATEIYAQADVRVAAAYALAHG